jgi:hypothetical protein
MGDTLPSTEASITLSSTQNSVSLSWAAVTNATEYRIFRTSANGATNTQKFLQSTENLTFVDVSPDADLDTDTVPTSNTTAGTVDGDSYATDYAASEIMIDTLSPITTATSLDVVYRNIYGDVNYMSVTPGLTVGSQVQCKHKGLGNPSHDYRIKTGGSKRKGRTIEVGINDIIGVGNLPATGGLAIYGHNHLFHMAPTSSNKWETQYFNNSFTFSGGQEIIFGISGNSALTTSARHDVVLLGVLE